MDPHLRALALSWAHDDPSSEDAAELLSLVEADREDELRERFSGPLEFGTAGLRGVMGAGQARMNLAVILRTTAGVAAYLRETYSHEALSRGVVIGHDARKGSRAFAEATASVLAAAGVRSFLFDELVATPIVAYATRRLGCLAGIMITASHNPPEYNGYKLYAENGAQIIPPVDTRIAEAIERASPARLVPRKTLEAARQEGLLMPPPPEVLRDYLDQVVALSAHAPAPLSMVYTPMHGVGGVFVKEVLAKLGYPTIEAVPEQMEPDGSFPTVRFPNPEEPGALSLAFQLARRSHAELILANDPDADRLAVAIPTRGGDFRQLTGNEVGLLLADYLLRTRPRTEARWLVLTTVVSSPTLAALAARHDARYEETLTGFKWIATRALELEAKENVRFLFGFEEALGYCVGSLVRDKDGISAAALFAELAAQCVAAGGSLEGELERLAREYGVSLSAQISLTRAGAAGAQEIHAIMERLRATRSPQLFGLPLRELRDLLTGERWSPEPAATGRLPQGDVPRSNVLIFSLQGARVIARPSGTEPKIKIYLDVSEPLEAGGTLEEARERAATRLRSLQEAIRREIHPEPK